MYLCCGLFVVCFFMLVCYIMRAGTTVEQVRKTWAREGVRRNLAHFLMMVSRHCLRVLLLMKRVDDGLVIFLFKLHDFCFDSLV